MVGSLSTFRTSGFVRLSADDAIGMIVMWAGNPALRPRGWEVCDGSNGTPDLRNRFAGGASSFDGVPKYETLGGPEAVFGDVTHNHNAMPGAAIADNPVGGLATTTSDAGNIPPFAAAYYIMRCK